jgi:hypothetical protein
MRAVILSSACIVATVPSSQMLACADADQPTKSTADSIISQKPKRPKPALYLL